MLEFRSALTGRMAETDRPASEGTGIVIGETRLLGLGQIAGWADFEPAAAPALDQLGLSGIGEFRQVQEGTDCHAYRIAPNRLLIRHADRDTLLAALSGVESTCAVTLDLSHARTCLTLQGDAAEDVLSRVATLDFHLSAFPVGSFAQTGIHHVAVLLHRRAEHRFDMLVPVTWAVTTFDYLRGNALSSGLHVGTAAR